MTMMIIAAVWDVALCILEQQKCTDISVKPSGSIIRVNNICNRIVWNVGTLLPDHMATYPSRQQFSGVRILLVNILYQPKNWLKIHETASFMQWVLIDHIYTYQYHNMEMLLQYAWVTFPGFVSIHSPWRPLISLVAALPMMVQTGRRQPKRPSIQPLCWAADVFWQPTLTPGMGTDALLESFWLLSSGISCGGGQGGGSSLGDDDCRLNCPNSSLMHSML